MGPSIDAESSVLITDALIFTGHDFIEDGYVYVLNGLVEDVGPSPAPSVPDGVRRVSKPNHTVLPGLIDCHIHADQGNIAGIEQSLRFGVTTVFDMHNEHVNVKKLLKLSEDPSNKSRYATYKTVGLGATIPGGWPEPIVRLHDQSDKTNADIATWPKLTDPSEARPFVAAQAALPASAIKLMHESGSGLGFEFPLATTALQTAVVDAAHAAGLKAVGHALALRDTMTLLAAGVDGLAHTFFDEPPDAAVVAAYRANNAHCTPTLVAIGSLTTEGEAAQLALAEAPLAKRLLMSDVAKQNLCRCMAVAKAQPGTVKHAYASVRALRKAGVPVVLGSDAAGPALGTAYGLTVHQEMEVLVRECEMNVLEVLRSATSVGAERFGWKDRGVLERGRNGDVVLLGGDVRKTLGSGAQVQLLDLKGVWREGVVCEVWRDVLEA